MLKRLKSGLLLRILVMSKGPDGGEGRGEGDGAEVDGEGDK